VRAGSRGTGNAAFPGVMRWTASRSRTGALVMRTAPSRSGELVRPKLAVIKVKRLSPGSGDLRWDALLAKQARRPSWLMSVDHPPQRPGTPPASTSSRRQVEGGRRQAAGHAPPAGPAIFLIFRRRARENFGGRTPLYFGYSQLNPAAMALARNITRTRWPPLTLMASSFGRTRSASYLPGPGFRA